MNNSGERVSDIFFKQTSYVYESLYYHLSHSIETEENLLALAAMSVFFLGVDRDIGERAFTKLRVQFDKLPKIEESGMAVHDCLAAALYWNAAQITTKKLAKDVEKSVHSRIQYAHNHNWLDRPLLAAVVHLTLPNTWKGIQSSAKQYLTNNTSIWIQNNYVEGMICSMTLGSKGVQDISSLSQLVCDQPTHDCLSLATALLVFSNLKRHGIHQDECLSELADKLYISLKESRQFKEIYNQNSVQAIIGLELSNFHLAASLYALQKCGFSEYNEPQKLDHMLSNTIR